LQTRHEDCDAPTWRARVIETLHQRFDALLHHADPSWVAFHSVFPDAPRLRIPMHATGVVHRVEPDDPAQLPHGLDGTRFAVCSVGGGSDGAGLTSAVRKAWRRLRATGAAPLDRLVICGAESGPASVPEEGVLELPFVPRFDVLLRRARLSLSHAGYNTCADLLRFGVPALLLPHPAMSDQAPRAALMSRIGAAQVLGPGALEPEPLCRAIADALARGPRAAGCDLDGARRTRRLVEGLRPPAAGSGRS
jgi:predicted glycosyltransferase